MSWPEIGFAFPKSRGDVELACSVVLLLVTDHRKQAVIEIAKRVVVPADASKIGQTDFYRIAGLGSVDTIVTDQPNELLASWCVRSGTELLIAD